MDDRKFYYFERLNPWKQYSRKFSTDEEALNYAKENGYTSVYYEVFILKEGCKGNE